MHRDSGSPDAWENICSIPAMTVQRLRMDRTLKVEGLASRSAESLILPIKGAVKVSVKGGKGARLGEKDVMYLPRDSVFDLEARSPAEVIWARAPAESMHKPLVKRFAKIVPVVSGVGGYHRRIYTSLGEKDRAERFIVGFVEGDAGNWTSFPPHKHDGKPEIYIYYGMGRRFGVQVVAGQEDKAFVVRDRDAVFFEEGYHPNVAAPGVGMNFVWIISAEPSERNLKVDIHPDYKDMPMGRTHLTTR